MGGQQGESSRKVAARWQEGKPGRGGGRRDSKTYYRKAEKCEPISLR